MKYISTRQQEETNIKTAILKGMAGDGGLFMPEYIPQLDSEFFENLPNLTLQEIGFRVAKELRTPPHEPAGFRQLAAQSAAFGRPGPVV